MVGRNSVTEHDVARMLDVVSPDIPVTDGPGLPDQVMRGLSDLIPCSSTSLCVFDPFTLETALDQDFDLRDIPPLSDDDLALHDAAYWDFPPCSRPEAISGPGVASMWQDYLGDREYERTLMAEFYRRGGFRHHLVVLLPPSDGLHRKVILWRDEGDAPFSERDRLLLTLLRPHLAEVHDRVEAQRRTIPHLTSRQVELMGRVARGDTNRQIARRLGLSEATVRKHLENIYSRLDVHSRTEALARIGPLPSRRV